MKTEAPKKNAPESTDEAQSIIDAASKQPGVAELLKVYESWRSFESVRDVYVQATTPQQVISLSSSSAPVLRHVS